MPDAPVLTLELREPPSANRWWRYVGGRVLTSRAAREYKQHVANAVLLAGARPVPTPTPVAVAVTWYRGRRSGDLDKRLGVLLDALQGAAYDNDSQITSISATREDDPGNARVRVSIVALPPFTTTREEG